MSSWKQSENFNQNPLSVDNNIYNEQINKR